MTDKALPDLTKGKFSGGGYNSQSIQYDYSFWINSHTCQGLIYEHGHQF